jgi:type VI secretion system secreted protein VgrG
MEVMVTYLDGDPDRPVVTGVVPNPKQKVPYTRPENKTRSVFKTRTHKGKGHNELYFEDEGRKEEIYIHAQKDMNTHVLNDRSKRVEHDQNEYVRRQKSLIDRGRYDEDIGKIRKIRVGDEFILEVDEMKKIRRTKCGLPGLIGETDFGGM